MASRSVYDLPPQRTPQRVRPHVRDPSTQHPRRGPVVTSSTLEKLFFGRDRDHDKMMHEMSDGAFLDENFNGHHHFVPCAG